MTIMGGFESASIIGAVGSNELFLHVKNTSWRILNNNNNCYNVYNNNNSYSKNDFIYNYFYIV